MEIPDRPSANVFGVLVTRTWDLGGPERTPRDRIRHDIEHPPSIGEQLADLIEVGERARASAWRIAYGTSWFGFICTIGTAIVGTVLSVFTFSQSHPTVQKGLALMVAMLGVILSTLKGTGLPSTAFDNVVKIQSYLNDVTGFVHILENRKTQNREGTTDPKELYPLPKPTNLSEEAWNAFVSDDMRILFLVGYYRDEWDTVYSQLIAWRKNTWVGVSVKSQGSGQNN